MGFWDDDNDSRRSLGLRDRQILYRNAKGRCQNPACGKKIEFDEMQVGHKTAWSKGGSTSFSNCLCLCYACNKLQGTDRWAVFMKKQGIEDPKTMVKHELEKLTVAQLKILAGKLHVRVSGSLDEGPFDTRQLSPTKRQYVNKLASAVTIDQLRSLTAQSSEPLKKRTRKKTD
jgi:hypothetical protein